MIYIYIFCILKECAWSISSIRLKSEASNNVESPRKRPTGYRGGVPLKVDLSVIMFSFLLSHFHYFILHVFISFFSIVIKNYFHLNKCLLKDCSIILLLNDHLSFVWVMIIISCEYNHIYTCPSCVWSRKTVWLCISLWNV